MPFDTLLASVKPRPVSTGRPLAPTGLPGTQIWDQADWFAWEKAKSSMIVPMKDGASAVGDFGRTVVTTSFHALCWLLGDFHTADEIEEAWERMPLVKMARGKDKYRGVKGGRSSRSWSSRSWEW